jgi:hypothetical protein
MNDFQKDRGILRSLAERYSEIANLDIQRERIERYYRTISMDEVRPVVLINEVPWGEIRDDELVCRCENNELRGLERQLRISLYQWDHFQADYVIPPVFRVGKRIRSSGIGIAVQEDRMAGNTGTYIVSHRYKDQLNTEEDLEKLKIPVITYDKESTEKAADLASDVFSDLLPVEVVGTTFGYSIWDHVYQLRGVEKFFMDFATRPDFMHKTAKKFTDIGVAIARQYQELDLLDPNPLLLHCTPACARELPAADFSGKIRHKDVWGRGSAQIFSSVSPSMHDEFDLAYSQKLFGECGLLYYGCCEPLDLKIDILRKRFRNLRKVSITPWADPEVAARNIGSDYVLAAKPNPAFVNSPTFNPEPVEQEMRQFLDACKKYGTTCEFVLKDISTIANNPNNLTQWCDTVKNVIDQYY